MGFRARSATPGTILCLAATILLALVSFNTPLLKSLNFLSATYTAGSNAGTVTFGTLGYCLEANGQTTCQGPTVGYKLDLNEILGVSLFDIPDAIGKVLTYVLIVHIVALGAGVLSVIFGLLSHFSGMGVLCFPTCTAAVTSSLALLALVIDLVIFYIAKARIDKVAGASATIGISVWLTLAAWLCAGFAGCAYGIGNCCVGSRRAKPSGDPDAESSYNKRRFDKSDGEHWRMQALAAEQARKKETGLPSFPDYERTPLTAHEDEDAKYLQEEPVPALRRDGSVINNVGVGYGRKTPSQPAWQTQDPYANSGGQAGYGSHRSLSTRSQTTSAGEFAGVGAGAAAAAAAAGYAAHQQQGQQQQQQGQYGHYDDYYDQAQTQNQYQDPYAAAAQTQQGYAEPYGNAQQDSYADAYQRQDTYHEDPYAGQQQQPYDPYSGYGQTPIPVPSPVQQRPVSDAYDAIGVSATTAGAGQHARDYTGTELQNPRPQHLHQQQAAAELLSPTSPVDAGPSPPSYGDAAAQHEYPNEKARYR